MPNPSVLNLKPNVPGIYELVSYMTRYAVAAAIPAGAAAMIDPEAVDSDLRARLEYVFPVIQELRIPRYLLNEYVTTGKFRGNCADLATLAASMLYNAPAVASLRFTVARPNPGDLYTWHVFLSVTLRDGRRFRIDPTAPLDADYSRAEILEFPLR